jgi:uncharacterized protein YqgC (DUF456 family)
VDVVLVQILLVLLYIALGLVLLTTALGVPANWILVGVALVVALASRFTAMTWGHLALCVGLAGVGEVIESVLGAIFIVRRGGTWWGVVGSIAGGLLGVVLGAGVAPPFGAVAFGFVGAFAGAVAGEMARQRRLEPALRIGVWSFVGRMAAVAAKVALGFAILWVIIVTTWP